MNVEPAADLDNWPGEEPPQVIAPDAGRVFAARAARFDALAEGHVLGDWLHFLALLSRAQHEAMQDLPQIALPDASRLAQDREFGMPSLPAQSWPRDPIWQTVLHRIADATRPHVPETARPELARLTVLPSQTLERLADRVLQMDLYGEDVALLPFVAAALQVVWTAGAARLGGIAPLDVPGVCPCCGFLPVASMIRGAGGVSNLRYLHCALCNTEWHLVRIKCAACGADHGIGYRHLARDDLRQPGVVQAETCESCRSYLKIVHPDRGGADPVADDLATLALDILVDEAGYTRSGPNLLLAGIG